MADNLEKLQSLFDIWKKMNFPLDFYFKNIFALALAALAQNTAPSVAGEIRDGKYKSLFVPVGYSIENIALITAFIKPAQLTLCFTEATRKFHRNNLSLIEENIKQYCPNPAIDKSVVVRSSSQQDIMDHVMQWVQASGYTHAELAVDLTGGTKPMAIGAQQAVACLKDIDAFYLCTDYDEDTQQPLPGSESLVKLMVGDYTEVNEKQVFVIMPFSAGYYKIFNWIRETANSLGLDCKRADTEIFQGGIMEQVQQDITKAGIIVAELTEENPNVYYELGIAHAKKKNVIMLTQDIAQVPFDLQHLRFKKYNPADKKRFMDELTAEINSFKK